MPQRPDHLAGDPGDLLEVGLGAGGDVAVDELLGRAAAERADDAAAQVVGRVAVAIGVGLWKVTPSARPRGMIEILRTGSAPGLEHPEQRVPGLVVGGALALLGREHDPPLGAEHDPLERVGEVGQLHLLVVAAGGGQRGLVDEVAQVGADHARASTRRARRGRRPAPSGTPRVCTSRICAAPGLVGRVHGHAAVEPARAQERRVEDLGAVGRRDHDHALGAGEAVHLGQDLVQRLLALVVAAAERVRAAAGAADRVQLVDEDDRRGGRLGLRRTGRARGSRRRRRSSR